MLGSRCRRCLSPRRDRPLVRPVAVAGALVVASVLCTTAPAIADDDAPDVWLLSVASSGAYLRGDVDGPVALSADGSVAAFRTDDGVDSEVYVNDGNAGTTELLTADGDFRASGSSTAVALSADGSRAVFDSDSADMTGSDGSGVARVYLRDRTAGHTLIVPSTDGDGAEQPATAPAISANGNRLAFTRHDPSGDVIEVADLAADDTTTVAATIALGDASGVRAALSADGSTVAYYAGGAVHVYDVSTHTEVATLDAAFDGREDPGLPALSADGTVLAYVNAVPAGASGNAASVLLDRVFVVDRSVSDPTPAALPVADGGSVLDQPSISADGRVVATTAWWGHDLDTGTPGFEADGGWIVDRSTGLGTIVDTGAGNSPHTVSLSADAGTVAFTTGSSDFSDEGQVRAFAMAAPDASVPTFRSGDELEATDVGPTSLTLTWPQAVGPVTGYHLTRDGADLADTDASATTLEVTGLQPATEYTFTVTATGAGGVASQPLSLQAASADNVPPTFPDGEQLVVSRLTTVSLRVAWPAATDNLALGGYRLAIDGTDVLNAPVGALYDDIGGLDPASSHHISVRPYDAQGNEGAALEVDVTTFARLLITKITSAELDFFWDVPADDPPSAVTGFVFETAPTCADAMGSPREVATDVHTIALTGLTSSTSLCGQVFARHADGSESAWTEPFAASTAVLATPSIEFSAPRVLGVSGLLQLGATMAIRMTGEPGRTASATLWQDDVGAGAHAAAPLTEGEPGIYTGSYHIDGSLNRFDALVGTLSDGVHDAVADADGMPIWVGGDLDLTVTDSVDPLPGLVLHLEAARTWDESLDVPVTAGTTATLHLPYGTYTATLVMPDGDVVATEPDVVVDSGGSSSLTLTPVRHNLLHVHLVAAAGQQPGGYTVTVTGPDGAELGQQDIPLGQADADFTVPAHVEVTATARLIDVTRPVSTTITGSLTTDTGRVTMTLTSRALPTATVVATVTADGEPLPGAAVAVVEHVDGRDWSYSATADAHGVARVTALAGEARVVASGAARLVSGQDQTLPADAETSLAFDLLPTPTYHIHPHVFTRQAGGDEVEQPLDWRTVVHFSIRLTVAGRSQPMLPDVVTAGSGGEQVRLCANGSQGGLTSGCTTATLGADADVDVDLHLSQAGVVTATLVDADDAAYTGAWAAEVHPVDADGSLGATTAGTSGTGGQVQLPVTNPGDGIVVIHGNGVSTGPVSFHLANGDTTDLGTLTMRADVSTDPATILVSPSPALPGQPLGIRVSLPWSTVHAGDQLQVTVPAHTEFEAASVTVDGIAADVVPGDDGAWLVPLNRPTVSSPPPAVIRYAVTVAPDAPNGSLDSIVRLRHADGTITDVGVASTTLAGVTVAGPRTVAHPVFTVSGTAPAGAAVTLYAGSDVAGQATAGPGGRYTATVTNTEPLSGFERSVVATATVNGVELRSDPLYVTYDADAVQPISATVENGAGTAGSASRAISFDPSAGVAAFTQVYVPGAPTIVTLRFADASRISNFSAAVGSNVAAGSCTGDTCTATVPTSSSTVGDVYVDYDVAPLPYPNLDAVPNPSAEQLRHNLPGVFAQATATSWDPAASSATFTLPGLGDVDVNVDIAPVETYTPTADDEALQQATGIEAYGTTIEMTGNTLTMSMLLPTAWLNERLGGLDDASGQQHAAVAPTAVVLGLPPLTEKFLSEIHISWFFNWATVATITNTFGEELFGGGLFADLHDLDADIDALMQCNPELQEQTHGIVTLARSDIIVNKTAGLLLSVMGMFEGSLASAVGVKGVVTQMGVDGVIGGIVDNVISWTSDAKLEQAQKDVQAAIDSAQCVGKKFHPLPLPQDPPVPRNPMPPTRHKIASPTYIFDPSGFAYTGITADRLEGVTATILTAPSADGPWTAWDAAAFGQTSPQLTDANGQYGWDVPTGYYQVRYSKPGFQTVESEVVHVLPERMDLDVNMLATDPPTVTAFAGDETGATVTFDRWMDVSSVQSGLTASAGGQALPALVTPSDVQQAPDGTLLAKTFVLALATPAAPGTALTFTVAAATVDYAAVAVGTDVTRTVHVAAAETPPTTTPTTPATPPPSSGPAATPPASAAPDPFTEPGSLPVTGSGARGVVQVALLLVLVGIPVAAVRRRRGRRLRARP